MKLAACAPGRWSYRGRVAAAAAARAPPCPLSSSSSGGSGSRRRTHICSSNTPAPAPAPSPPADTNAPRTASRTASVQVDLGYATESVAVQLTNNSRLLNASMAFPLGLVLEQGADGQVVVTEVSDGSAAAAAGCRVGDVVRATTATTMQMTYPTMNVLFGGVGRPKLTKMLLPIASVPFAKVMDAVRSNTLQQGGDGTVTLVLERAGDGGGSDAECESDCEAELFDASLFE